MDGTLGSQTALDARRQRRADHERRASSPRSCARGAAAGFPVAVHAIGDRANREALDAFEQTRDVWEPLGLRQRIEHAQLLAPEDLPASRQLGVACSVQFSHAPSDRDLADRYWAGKTDGAYAYRSLLDSGAVVANGSDAPIEELDPLAGIRAGVRRTIDDRPAWHPEQALTVEQAFQATCVAPGLARGRRAPARHAPPRPLRRPRRARPRPVGGPRRGGRRDDGRRPLGAQPAALVVETRTGSRAAPATRFVLRAPYARAIVRLAHAGDRSGSSSCTHPGGTDHEAPSDRHHRARGARLRRRSPRLRPAGGKGRLFQFRGDVLATSATSVQVAGRGRQPRRAPGADRPEPEPDVHDRRRRPSSSVWTAGRPARRHDRRPEGRRLRPGVDPRDGRLLARRPRGEAAGTRRRPRQQLRHGAPPLFLYVGTVAGAAGRRPHRAARHGRQLARRCARCSASRLDQTFTYDDGTIFLLWQGKVPTVIDAVAAEGRRPRSRSAIRAPRAATLAQVEATAAAHVGDHEPGDPTTQNS